MTREIDMVDGQGGKGSGGWCCPPLDVPAISAHRGGITFPSPVTTTDPSAATTWNLVRRHHLDALQTALLTDSKKDLRRAARQVLLHMRDLTLTKNDQP